MAAAQTELLLGDNQDLFWLSFISYYRKRYCGKQARRWLSRSSLVSAHFVVAYSMSVSSALEYLKHRLTIVAIGITLPELILDLSVAG